MRKLRPRKVSNLPTFICLWMEFIPKASVLNHSAPLPFYLTQTTQENRTARVIARSSNVIWSFQGPSEGYKTPFPFYGWRNWPWGVASLKSYSLPNWQYCVGSKTAQFSLSDSPVAIQLEQHIMQEPRSRLYYIFLQFIFSFPYCVGHGWFSWLCVYVIAYLLGDEIWVQWFMGWDWIPLCCPSVSFTKNANN